MPAPMQLNKPFVRRILDNPHIDALTIVQVAAMLDPDMFQERARVMAEAKESRTLYGVWTEMAENRLRERLED